MRKTITFGLTAALLIGLMLVPGAAAARKARHKGRSCPRSIRVDRNRDGLPDRWECQHRLSLRVNQSRRDPDRDGLNNAGEYKAGDDPHNPDTNGNGIKDGDEHAGTIASFDAGTGVLVINLDGGGTVSGAVTDQTELSCKPVGASARSARNDRGDGPPTGAGGDPPPPDPGSGDTPAPGDGQGDPTGSGDDPSPDENACSVGDLRPGRTVREASLQISTDGAVFDRVELAV
jgi:hypothetical protein